MSEQCPVRDNLAVVQKMKESKSNHTMLQGETIGKQCNSYYWELKDIYDKHVQQQRLLTFFNEHFG